MMVSEASRAEEVSVVPPSSSNNNSMTSAEEKSNSTPKGGKMSVSDFVSASFARFEAEYGPSLAEVSAGSEATKLLASSHANSNSNGNTATKGSIGEDNNIDNEGNHLDEEEPFWSLLLTLYIPLLLFGLRRSTFGTFSFLRTFLLGHVLRLLISFILCSIPTSFGDSLDKWWGKVVQLYWVQHILWAITGEERFHPHNQYHHHHHSGSISHHHCCNEGTAGSFSVCATPGNIASRRGFNPDHVWPPPALTVLTLITVVAFVVHPDGLTWIMLGKLVDGATYVMQLISFGLVMLRDEPIHTMAAAASLSGLVFLGGVIHRTLSSKTTRHASQAEDGGLSSSSRKTKKGKKGKNGRHGHHNTSRGRGKVRGGHFRSAKDLYDSPTRHRSRSRSLPRSEEDTQKNECKASQVADDSVSKDVDGRNPSSPKVLTRESRDSVVSLDSQTSQLLSQHSFSKLRPYSVDSSLPQLSDDVSSCSSVAGSLIEAPGSKPLKCVLEDADNNLNRRKSTHGSKRGKSTATLGANSFSHQSSATRAPPGFIANDPTMTPSRVSPLTVSNLASSPEKRSGCASISPIRKAVTRPTPLTAKTCHDGSSLLQHASRTRALTTDGTIKHSYSAPPSNSTVSTGKSSVHFQSQSLNHPPGIVRYGLPDYSAYAQSDSRYDPRKIELAAFLARVGLVGSACADLLKDLFDVDALAALTPEQLFAYNIRSEKQIEIAALLKARQLSFQQMQQSHQKPKSASASLIRPPPGLGFCCTSAASESGFVTLPNAPVSPITRPLFQASRFAPYSSSDFLLSSPVSSNYGYDGASKFTLQSLRSTSNNSVITEQATDPLIQGTFCQRNSSRPLPIGSRLFSSVDCAESSQTEDEKIDADLRLLGDRMVGSILDF